MTAPLALPALRRYLRHGTLPQLAAFEAVVQLGSVTLAAEALCVAQPTVSGHLKKLGDSLGVRLFDLRGRRLVPTAAAFALLEATHELSAVFARCEQTLDAYRDDASARRDRTPLRTASRDLALSDARA